MKICNRLKLDCKCKCSRVQSEFRHTAMVIIPVWPHGIYLCWLFNFCRSWTRQYSCLPWVRFRTPLRVFILTILTILKKLCAINGVWAFTFRDTKKVFCKTRTVYLNTVFEVEIYLVSKKWSNLSFIQLAIAAGYSTRKILK